jgi:hypothetical protein
MSLPTPPEKVAKLQSTLHAKAKTEPSYRFYSLWDKVCREDVLTHAYKSCRADVIPGGSGASTCVLRVSGALPSASLLIRECFRATRRGGTGRGWPVILELLRASQRSSNGGDLAHSRNSWYGWSPSPECSSCHDSSRSLAVIMVRGALSAPIVSLASRYLPCPMYTYAPTGTWCPLCNRFGSCAASLAMNAMSLQRRKPNWSASNRALAALVQPVPH